MEITIKNYQALIDKMLKNKNFYKETIETKIKVDYLIEKLYCYPKRFTDLNNLDEEHQEMVDQAWNIYEEILKLNQKCLNNILKNSQLETEFLKENPYFKRYFEIIKTEIVNHSIKELETIKKIYRTLTENDLQFGYIKNENQKKVILNFQNYNEFITNKNESKKCL